MSICGSQVIRKAIYGSFSTIYNPQTQLWIVDEPQQC